MSLAARMVMCLATKAEAPLSPSSSPDPKELLPKKLRWLAQSVVTTFQNATSKRFKKQIT
jgi:hypothetical protein